MKVGGLVLAAGRSRRMGRPKALLAAGEETFLEAAVGSLTRGGCDPVAAVVPDRSDLIQAALETGAVAALNPDPGSEQIESLRIGLTALPDDATAALVLPVDHPLIQRATVEALIAAHAGRPDAVVRPRLNGRPGHPTLFPRATWPLLYDARLDRGARDVLDSGGVEVLDVDVDDPGVLADIDTPEEYQAWLDGRRTG